MVIVSIEYSALSKAIADQLAVFPAHEKFLHARFKDQDAQQLAFADELAGMIQKIAGDDFAQIAADYQWMTKNMVEEELFFRRNNRYRMSTFAEAQAEVYDDAVYMGKYINGLLLSQLWWSNHTASLKFFRDSFLTSLPSGFNLLDIGPGHGLFLWLATEMANANSVEGWDVSPASLEGTREALRAMNIADEAVPLKKFDVVKKAEGEFDALVFSEVLEHLETPREALQNLLGLLKPGGRIFVNAPANSPAPDHIWLFRSPEEVRDMVEEAGFKIVDTLYSPYTGITLQRARDLEATISAVVVGEKP